MRNRLACRLVLGLALVLVAAAVLCAQALRPDLAEQQAKCLLNIRQLGLAMLMYANDWDDKFPRADQWTDVTKPCRRNDAILRCPADKKKYSYAMNYSLGLKPLSGIKEPWRTVLLFESTRGRKNACDAGTSWPKSPRHPGGNCVAFVDGHAQCLSKKPDFRLNPKPAK